MVDAHSPTWKALTDILAKERDIAIGYLIHDKDADKQRGKIQLIEKILSLPNATTKRPVEQDIYN